MKKWLITLGVVVALAALLCVGVLADAPETAGIYGVTEAETVPAGVTVSVQVYAEGVDPTGSGATAIDAASAQLDEDTTVDDFYADGVKLLVTVEGLTGNSYYLILAQNNDGDPTESNIVYINQDSASSTGSVSFVVYPKELQEDKIYHIYIAGGALGKTELLSFQYYAAYMLGDTDCDGEVTADDALMTLQAVVGLVDLNGTQTLAADVDRDKEVTADDALYILQAVVGLIEFDDLV